MNVDDKIRIIRPKKRKENDANENERAVGEKEKKRTENKKEKKEASRTLKIPYTFHQFRVCIFIVTSLFIKAIIWNCRVIHDLN